MTEALKLIQDSAFDSETVALMGQAFDAAWSDVASDFETQPQAVIDQARTKLAQAVIHLAATGMLEPDMLKGAALDVLRQSDPRLKPSGDAP